MIKVTLEFDDVSETLDALFKLYGKDVRGGATQIDSPTRIIDLQPITTTAAVKPTPPAEAPKRRGRPPKNAAAQETTSARQPERVVAEATVLATAPVAAAPVVGAPPLQGIVPPAAPAKVIAEYSGPSQSDALVALEKLFSKKGMPVAEATLKKYGANKLRELERKHYPAFVKDCHDQVNA